MAKQGGKHLVKCICILPQLSKLKDPPLHEFVVFSVYDDANDDFESTFVQCDSCGVIHKVVDLCTSTVVRGKDEMRSVITIDDVRGSVPANMAATLEMHKADLPTWQQVAWIIEEKRWGSYVVLTFEYIDGTKHGKAMTILGDTLYKINNFTNETVAG